MISIFLLGSCTLNNPSVTSADDLERSVFKMTSEVCDSNDLSTFVGFAVTNDAGDNLIVTTAHGIEDIESVEALGLDSKALAGLELVTIDAATDVAIFSTTSRVDSLILFTPDVSNVTSFATFSDGLTLNNVTTGEVENVSIDDGPEKESISVTAQIKPGDSGAPLLDDNGNVHGMVFADSKNDVDSGWALSTSEIRKVLASTIAENLPDISC